MKSETRSLESHFEFGSNWSHYASSIGRSEVEKAKSDLARLVGGRIAGATFIDIGCGSGIHSLAAAELGADVTAIDIDPSSVGTTKALLERFGLTESVDVNCSSVFDLSSNPRRFDIVYSWGVLHHTGGLSDAIEITAKLVKPGGVLVLAIYRRTRFCWWWKFEKRLYKDSPRWAQVAIKKTYVILLRARLRLTGVKWSTYLASYGADRGMHFTNDVHDWLGGYPYESMRPQDLIRLVCDQGFGECETDIQSSHTPLGFFGSGCQEYVFVKES